MRVLLTLLLLVPLAGCLDGADPPAPAEPEPTPDPAPLDAVVVEAPEAQADGNATGGFRFVAEGGAGGHLVAYQPFPEVRDSAEFDYSWSFSVGEPGGHAFWTGLTPTVREGGGFGMVDFTPFETERILAFEGGLDLRNGGSYAMSCSCGIDGLMMTAAADGPWRLEVEVRWGEGDLAAPAFVSAGRGAVFSVGTDWPLPSAGAGRLDLEAAVDEPGWTHVEVLGLHLQPAGVQDSSFRFPSGFEAGGTGYRAGYYVPVLIGGTSTSSGVVDYAGTPNGTAGDLSASVTFAEPATEVDLAWMHLPGAGLPDGFRGDGYSGSNWPFENPLPGGG